MKNIALKFGQNQVSNRWNTVVVFVVVVIVIVVHVVVIVVGEPRHLPLKFGQNWVSNSWDIADIEFPVGGVQNHFHVKPYLGWVEFWLSWNVVELGLWQFYLGV